MSKQDSKQLSRRSMLKGAAALAGIAVVPGAMIGTARAAKAPKKSVMYQDQPKNDQHCATCNFFMAGDGKTGTCQVVEGDISPNGWCSLWAAKA